MLALCPHPYHLEKGKRDEDEDEARRMEDSPRTLPVWLLVDRWRGGGEVVAMASTQSLAWCPLFPLPDCWHKLARW